MAKKVQGYVNLVLPAQQANPDSPGVGPGLGSMGVNIEAFCKDFNAETVQYAAGTLLKTVVTVYDDSSYTFTTEPVV